MTWIGNLAALVPHKDHDTLLAAAVLVLFKRPNARFIIAGRGPEEAFDDSPRFADAMAASQLATEEAILEAARRLLRATGSALKGIPT